MSQDKARPDRRRTTASKSPSSKGVTRATHTPTQQDTRANLVGHSRESTVMEHRWFRVPQSRRSVNSHLPKPAKRPPADQRRQPIHGTLIEGERNRGHGELFAMTYEDTALTVQPDCSHDQRRPIGVGYEAPHEINSKPQERSRFFAYKLPIDRSRPDCFPVENVNISGDIVFRRQGSQLLADEFSQSALTRHCLR